MSSHYTNMFDRLRGASLVPRRHDPSSSAEQHASLLHGSEEEHELEEPRLQGEHELEDDKHETQASDHKPNDKYDDDDDDDHPVPQVLNPLHQVLTPFRRLTSRSIWIASGVIVLIIVFLAGLASGGTTATSIATLPVPQWLYLVVPAARIEGDVDLCKTILSSQILNFPNPTLIPWAKWEWEKHPQDKIKRVHDWLAELPPKADDGLVILLDGPNTWFQLRPEVLLQRYWDISRRADQRLKKTYGQPVEQKVLFSAQDQCASDADTDVACYAAPESRAAGRWKPRYLGGGAMIGQIKDVLPILERALQKFEQDNFMDPVVVFGEIFGEQEYQRQSTKNPKWWWRTWDRVRHGHSNSALASVPGRPTWHANVRTDYEFGIGLDYDNELGIGTTLEEGHADWQTSKSHSRDIEDSMAPFWTTSGGEPNLPHDARWTDVDLFTLTDTATTPAMIHHTASNTSAAFAFREQWWPHLWMQPYSRTLLASIQSLPATVVASVKDKYGSEVRYWNHYPRMDKDGVWLANGEFSFWGTVCGQKGEWQELFRDDKGKWSKYN